MLSLATTRSPISEISRQANNLTYRLPTITVYCPYQSLCLTHALSDVLVNFRLEIQCSNSGRFHAWIANKDNAINYGNSNKEAIKFIKKNLFTGMNRYIVKDTEFSALYM
jgi:hypothetical protein